MSEVVEHIIKTPTERLVKRNQFRSEVLRFEESLKKHPAAMDRNDKFMQDLLEHSFCKGLYARDLAIPAGMALTGEIHFDEHFVFLMEGEILVTTEDGNKHLKAPQYFVTLGGTKRAAIALTDTLWVTVHPNPDNKKDIQKIEDRLVTSDFAEYDRYERRQKMYNKISSFFKKLLTLNFKKP